MKTNNNEKKQKDFYAAVSAIVKFIEKADKDALQKSANERNVFIENSK